MRPDDYTVTCYTGAQVIIEAVKQVATSGKPINRGTVRDAIQTVKLPDSLLGPVEFDANGDIKNRIISVFRITKNPGKPLDDPSEQYKYIGVAPMS
jgi:ABC-type branched-subunit amino acid transport system substrate-binding protein